MSEYLKQYEKGPPPRSCDPKTAEGQKNLRGAMANIDRVDTKWQGDDQSLYKKGDPMAPCPNCSRTLTNMSNRYGFDKSKVQPGYPPAKKSGDLSTRPPMTNDRPPTKDYVDGLARERADAATRAQNASESRQEARDHANGKA